MDYIVEHQEYLEETIKRCKLKGFSQKTIKTYNHVIRKYLEYLHKNRFNLDFESVKSYLLSLNLSVNSSRLYYAGLRFFFKEILNKPFTTFEIPIKKKEKVLPKVLSQNQIRIILSNCDNIKHRLVVKFLYSSGLRLQELVNLKKSDVDVEKNIVYIRKGKGNKDRISIISDKLNMDLLKYYSQNNFKTEYIFEGRYGKYSKKSVQAILQKLAKNQILNKELHHICLDIVLQHIY